MEGIISSILAMFAFMAVISVPISLREINKKLDVIISHLEYENK